MATLNIADADFTPADLLLTGLRHAGRAVECGESPDWYLQLYPGESIVLRCAVGGSNDDTWFAGWTLQNAQEACALLAQCAREGESRRLRRE